MQNIQFLFKIFLLKVYRRWGTQTNYLNFSQFSGICSMKSTEYYYIICENTGDKTQS